MTTIGTAGPKGPALGKQGAGLEIGKDKLLTLYRQMVAIRLFEERVNDLYTRALMPGLAHLYIGEEAIAVTATVWPRAPTRS